MLPVKYASGFYTRDGFLAAARGMLIGIDSGHLWFLPVLFWCTVFFVLLEKLLKKLNIHSDYLLLGISGAISLTYLSFPYDIFMLKEGMKYLIWFALGYIFEKERKRAALWNNKQLTLCVGGGQLAS